MIEPTPGVCEVLAFQARIQAAGEADQLRGLYRSSIAAVSA